MPRKRKGKKQQLNNSPSKPPDCLGREALNFTKKWLQGVQKAKSDYQYDEELMEINSDEESDEFECNLKELEVRLKGLLRIVELKPSERTLLLSSYSNLTSFISETTERFAVSIFSSILTHNIYLV